MNLVDNTSLDGQSFTAFGTVAEGMDVVDAIAAVETGSRSGLSDVPLEDILIESALRRSSQTEPLNVSIDGFPELEAGVGSRLTAVVDPEDEENQAYLWEVLDGDVTLLTLFDRRANISVPNDASGSSTVRVTVANQLTGAIGTADHTIRIKQPG